MTSLHHAVAASLKCFYEKKFDVESANVTDMLEKSYNIIQFLTVLSGGIEQKYYMMVEEHLAFFDDKATVQCFETDTYQYEREVLRTIRKTILHAEDYQKIITLPVFCARYRWVDAGLNRIRYEEASDTKITRKLKMLQYYGKDNFKSAFFIDEEGQVVVLGLLDKHIQSIDYESYYTVEMIYRQTDQFNHDRILINNCKVLSIDK